MGFVIWGTLAAIFVILMSINIRLSASNTYLQAVCKHLEAVNRYLHVMASAGRPGVKISEGFIAALDKSLKDMTGGL